MKLTYFQLEPHLNKKLAPIYIVSGNEPLLKQDAIHLIRQAAKKATITERCRLSPECAADWEQLYGLLYANSLFAEKRLLELDCQHSLPPKNAGVLLQDYAKNPSLDNLLLIDMDKIEDKVARSAWYTALEKAGMVITIWPLPHEQLPQWIMQRAKRSQLMIPIDAAKLLADYVEGNLIAAANTIEKLSLLQPQQAIDCDLIHRLVTDESRFNVFDFIENLFSGNQQRTLHILDNLKQDGAEPVFILWGITRELRLLIDIAQSLKQGQSHDMAFQKHRIFAKRQPAMRRFLAKSTIEDCWHHLSHAAHLDKIIKGAAPGNIWESLQLFCLRLI